MKYYGMEYSYAVISHHGIKGQRWGVRRYQNEDGSLTDAGKKRSLLGKAKDVVKDDVGRVKNVAKYGWKTGHAKNVSNRLANVRKDEKRMSRMSDRQKRSLKNAEKYWNERAEGKRGYGGRNIVARISDSQRSFSVGRRAARTYMPYSISALATKQTTGVGVPVTSKVLATAGNMVVDEAVTNVVFGHF